ncbi:MAG TPA: hypothetical protein PK208_00535 [Fibrobacteria bacterium]|nr:hypothetical protein [Fibrobacteria bacterium]
MSNRIALASGIVLLGAGAALATNARVESMGKHATYFMDDVSVWSNPANANLYPNYLLGELGTLRNSTEDTTNYKGFSRYNRDPKDPWFGAIFAKSFSPDVAGGNRYPQAVIGGAFNRGSEWDAYFPRAISLKGVATPFATETPVKFDGLLGAAFGNGLLVGVGTRLAYGDSSSGNDQVTSVMSVNTIGVNAPLGQGVDLEATATVAFLDAKIKDGSTSYGGEFEPSFGASARTFISAPQIFGVIVPAVSFRSITAPGLERTEFRIGSGANVSLDRGFFWMGVDYFNNAFDQNLLGKTLPNTPSSADIAIGDYVTSVTENGLRVSFGIERNIWTDWFVIRVGGQKVIANRDYSKNTEDNSRIVTNPNGGDPENDLVSFGFGLNIEDKLKVDAVMAKDILYTGGALLGGPTDHILSRISASYSF